MCSIFEPDNKTNMSNTPLFYFQIVLLYNKRMTYWNRRLHMRTTSTVTTVISHASKYLFLFWPFITSSNIFCLGSSVGAGTRTDITGTGQRSQNHVDPELAIVFNDKNAADAVFGTNADNTPTSDTSIDVVVCSNGFLVTSASSNTTVPSVSSAPSMY